MCGGHVCCGQHVGRIAVVHVGLVEQGRLLIAAAAIGTG